MKVTKSRIFFYWTASHWNEWYFTGSDTDSQQQNIWTTLLHLNSVFRKLTPSCFFIMIHLHPAFVLFSSIVSFSPSLCFAWIQFNSILCQEATRSYLNLRESLRSTKQMCWGCTGWLTATTSGLSTSRTGERTTFTTGDYWLSTGTHVALSVVLSSTSGTWFVGTVVGHQYGWLRNSSEDSKSKRWAFSWLLFDRQLNLLSDGSLTSSQDGSTDLL